MGVLRLGVLVSGGGSNLQAILDRIAEGRLPAEVAVVISNVPGVLALERAAKHGVPGAVIPHGDYPSREAFENAIVGVLAEHRVDLVVLAGFMRLLSGPVLDAYPQRVMNIHPALLPSFPGTHVWKAEVDHGVKFAGCTVHFVDRGMDTGPIVIQAVVPVLDDDDADTLAARILRQEHRIYSRAIQLYAEGRLRIVGRRVLCDPPEAPADEAVLVNPRMTDA